MKKKLLIVLLFFNSSFSMNKLCQKKRDGIVDEYIVKIGGFTLRVLSEKTLSPKDVDGLFKKVLENKKRQERAFVDMPLSDSSDDELGMTGTSSNTENNNSSWWSWLLPNSQ